MRKKPRSLCLYAKHYRELKINWSSHNLIERIREWLSLTSINRLHQDDQVLEPFFFCDYHLLLPFKCAEEMQKDSCLNIVSISPNVFAAFESVRSKGSKIIMINITTDAITHGLINRIPTNLKELYEILSRANADLIKELQNKLIKFKIEKRYLDKRLMLLCYIPKKRNSKLEIETTDVWAFLTSDTITQILPKIGVNNNLKIIDSVKGETCKIALLKPHFHFSKKMANLLADIPLEKELSFSLIGVGALGSHILNNFARMGIGRWLVIDNDILLPHNHARHVLHQVYTGWLKSEAMKDSISQLLFDNQFVESKAIDIFTIVNGENESIYSTFTNSDFIIDASTSDAVQKFLVYDIDSNARRISIFLSPSGKDLILLMEDNKREITLDMLEIQYYREILNNLILCEHLMYDTSNFRYSTSCSDISNRITEDIVALNSAICSRALLNGIKQNDAIIKIWSFSPHSENIEKIEVNVSKCYSITFADWIIKYDEALIGKLNQMRSKKLPNETGSILIGAYDMERKIVYVTDTIETPDDSLEYPYAFIRGCKNLKDELEKIKAITGNHLQYVGEWHSHPGKCYASSDDSKVLDWIHTILKQYERPGLMLVVGEEEYGFYLKE